MIKVCSSVCWGGEEAGEEAQHPGTKAAGRARSTPTCEAAARVQGGLRSRGICAVHETRLVLTALPREAVPLLLQLFGRVPDSRRKE